MLWLIAATLLTTADGGSPTGAPAPPTYTLRPELQIGFDAPLGLASLSAVYGPRDWLSLGGGVGIDADADALAYGLFARAHVLRLGAFKFGAAVALSRSDERHHTVFYGYDVANWAWAPAYRLDVGLGVEAKRGRWSARLEGGAGYVLNDAVCTYGMNDQTNPPQEFQGDCRTDIPAAYQHSSGAGGMPRWFALSIGMDLQPAGSTAASAAPGASDPGRPVWYGAPAIWADLAFLAIGALALQYESEGLMALSAATYALGAPINHVVHGHTKRGLASFGLRAGGALLAAVAAVGTVVCIDQSSNCGGWVVLLPIGPLAAIIIDDAYLSRAAP